MTANRITEYPSPPPAVVNGYYQNKLSFETDCADVHHALTTNSVNFILLDVRSKSLYEKGHIGGATNLPASTIDEKTTAQLTKDKLYVVYCAGPHCNGADKAAYKLSALGFHVKLMIGGISGWEYEGFQLSQ